MNERLITIAKLAVVWIASAPLLLALLVVFCLVAPVFIASALFEDRSPLP